MKKTCLPKLQINMRRGKGIKHNLRDHCQKCHSSSSKAVACDSNKHEIHKRGCAFHVKPPEKCIGQQGDCAEKDKRNREGKIVFHACQNRRNRLV